LIGALGLSLAGLAERLAPFEVTGLGTERERGFGRIYFSSPFHYQPEVNL
jgi:hypothetical protein